MEINVESRSKRWRLPFAIVLACVVLAGSSALGYRAYHRWQPDRLASRGGTLLAEGDYKNAALTARRALQINDKNLDATRVMAELAEKAGAPEAVIWWQRTV